MKTPRSRLSLVHRLGRAALVLWITAAFNPTVHAWWDSVHRYIAEESVQHLPQPLSGFFDRHRDEVGNWAATEPLGSHWLHLDFYPEFFAGTLPHDRSALEELYGAQVVSSHGTAPWTYAEYVETLTDLMATAQSQEDWFDLLRTAGRQSHFVQDLHNPLHLTENYNGQFTGNSGIHSRYEGRMIVRNFDNLPISQVDAVYLPSVIDDTFDDMKAHFWYLDDILAADDLHAGAPDADTYYAGMWQETGAFTQQLIQSATEAVANGWYTAWVDAGMPLTFLNGAADFDFDGDVDAQDLADWQFSFGIDGQADANFDGDSDGEDFLAWQRQFTENTSAASAQVLPEPGSLPLIIGALAFALVRRSGFRAKCYARG